MVQVSSKLDRIAYFFAPLLLEGLIAHDQIAQPVRAVRSRLFFSPAVGAAEAVAEVQVGPSDANVVTFTAKVLEEGLQGGDALLQPFLLLLASCNGILLRGTHRQGPGEHRQPEQTPGQAAPPAEPASDGVHLLFQGVETGLQLIHGGSSSAA
jgi:hypothetical protein